MIEVNGVFVLVPNIAGGQDSAHASRPRFELHRSRIYFNTLPPVDAETSRWADRVIRAARRWLVRHPRLWSYVYCGPATRDWMDAGGTWAL